MSVRTYNPSVRVGNWNEDIQLEEDTLKDFLERRERGELLIQKSASLMGSATSKVDLSVSRDGKVHIGDIVQLINPQTKDGSRGDCALSLSLADASSAGCGVTGSASTASSARNTFVITSMDGTAHGEQLRYGQSFYLCAANGSQKMYMTSDRATFQKCAKKSRNQIVEFVPEPSHLTAWKIVAFDPQYRFELEFSEVPANAKIILAHSKTNQNLNVESDHLLRSPFGKEFEVTAHTCLDSHKAETDTNHWLMVMNVPGDTYKPMTPPKEDCAPPAAGTAQ